MLIGLGLRLVFKLLHVIARGVDEVVGELAVALPGVAQQIQVSLLGYEAAQIVGGVEIRQARVIVQILQREREFVFCLRVD